MTKPLLTTLVPALVGALAVAAWADDPGMSVPEEPGPCLTCHTCDQP
ncbi:MAG: hypothetical protein GY778_10305 [bacterium]|nr:hypothetical protein [bacterium]